MDLFSHDYSQPQAVESFSKSEKLARLRLIRTDRVGPVTFRQLINKFGSAERALQALPELAKRGGRRKPQTPPPLKEAEKELRALEKAGGTALFWGGEGYPARLAAVEDAPPILFAKGHVSLLSKDSIGIVGARNASAAGIKMTRMIAHGLSEAGIVTVSGLARGIDTAAHAASLQGGTIACMAGGLDIIYPPENEDLYDAIINTGCIVTEMPLSAKPQARHFPRRNRLISGLSLGTLVIEAAEKSGSLISARYAADQGREVFAIPGSPLDPRAKGTNQLIRDGAILVESVQDIIAEMDQLRRRHFNDPEELPLFNHTPTTEADLPSDNARDKLLELLGHCPIHIDELIRQSDLDAGTVQAVILMLELAGHATRYPGNRIARLDDDAIY